MSAERRSRWLRGWRDVVDGSGLRCLTVAVVGGCGGAGATTLAAGLAITGSALGFRVLLVDGDPLGGGSTSRWGRSSARVCAGRTWREPWDVYRPRH